MKPNNKIMLIHVILFENFIIIIITTTYIIIIILKLYNNTFLYTYYTCYL